MCYQLPGDSRMLRVNQSSFKTFEQVEKQKYLLIFAQRIKIKVLGSRTHSELLLGVIQGNFQMKIEKICL